jgi:hypothetical protein
MSENQQYMVWDGDPNGDALLVEVLDSLEDANTVIDWNKHLPDTNFFITILKKANKMLDQEWHNKAQKELQRENRRPFFVYFFKNGQRYYSGGSTQVQIAKAGAIHGMNADREITSFLLSSRKLPCLNHTFK